MSKTPPPLPKKTQASSLQDALAAPSTASTVVTRSYRRTLEPWMIEVAAKAALEGLPMNLIAGLLQVSPKTFSRWISQGQEEGADELMASLSATVFEARSQAVQAGIRTLKVHALSDHKALIEYLRAMDPETFSPQTRSKIDLEVSAKAPAALPNLTAEQLLELKAHEEAAERLRSGGG